VVKELDAGERPGFPADMVIIREDETVTAEMAIT
jgi:hypothetical protein